MSRDYRLYLNDIAECCEKVLRYTIGYDLPRFVADTLVYDAVARNLEIIGEARISHQRCGRVTLMWSGEKSPDCAM